MMPPAGPQCKETHTARCHSRYAWMTRCRASLGEEAVVVVVPSAARLGENFNQARARKKKKKKRPYRLELPSQGVSVQSSWQR